MEVSWKQVVTNCRTTKRGVAGCFKVRQEEELTQLKMPFGRMEHLNNCDGTTQSWRDQKKLYLSGRVTEVVHSGETVVGPEFKAGVRGAQGGYKQVQKDHETPSGPFQTDLPGFRKALTGVTENVTRETEQSEEGEI